MPLFACTYSPGALRPAVCVGSADSLAAGISLEGGRGGGLPEPVTVVAHGHVVVAKAVAEGGHDGAAGGLGAELVLETEIIFWLSFAKKNIRWNHSF